MDLQEIKHWLRKISLFAFKKSILAFLGAIFVFTISVTVNFKTWEIEFKDAGISAYVLGTMAFFCILLLAIDVWLEYVRLKERTKREVQKTLRDPKVSEEFKRKLTDFHYKKE